MSRRSMNHPSVMLRSIAALPFCLACAITALFAFVPAATDAHAQTSRERRGQQRPGRIEVSTTPDGYPLIVDGKPEGATSATVRFIDLEPGAHTVEILFPGNNRWVQTFNIVGGKRYCIALAYRPKTITLPRVVQSPCPYPVNISSPSAVNEGNLVTFAAEVGYPGTAALNYNWTVSPPGARIVSGAGTRTITVDTTGLGRQRVAATLMVDDGSNDPACRQQAQASTLVTATPPPSIAPRRFDVFPSVAFDDDKARLDNLAIELQNNPTATGYVIVYGGSRSPAGRADRLGARAREYLTATRGIDANRIVVVNGGYRTRDTFELWLVPQGATPPQPTPTVQPEEVRPRRQRQ
ncbi:MAG: hypothetical protein H0T63_08270 [Pyrinomonadaceae bacterium]|nr:hypothetical protein [Pyrinomonadaceae bacterium]MDQ3585767.1 hypothetical protein [Acidobacteriota bacterium]